MVKGMGLVGVLVLVALFFGIAFAEPDLNPGKWEITTETQMPGMPMQMPPTTHTQCISQKDIVPQSQEPGQACEISNTNVSGDTVSWTIVCTNLGSPMEGKGQITYKGDQMHGTMEMVMEDEGIRMKSKIRGRRVGNCE